MCSTRRFCTQKYYFQKLWFTFFNFSQVCFYFVFNRNKSKKKITKPLAVFIKKIKINRNQKNYYVKFKDTVVKDNSVFSKVHIFWEGHKILRNLHRRFVLCSNGQIYGGDFAKFCGLLRIYELYQWRTSGNVNNYIGPLAFATHSFQTLSRANASTNNNLALIRGPTS